MTKDVTELGKDLGLKKHELKMFQKYHGIKSVLKEESLSLKSVLKNCIKGILSGLSNKEINRIKYIYYCHTLQVIQPVNINIIDEIKNELGLNHILSFSIAQQNCSSVIASLDIADQFLKNNPDKKVILISAEKTFTPITQKIGNNTLMGESGFACLLGNDGPLNKMVNFNSINLGKYYKGILMDQDDTRDFDQIYIKTLAKTIRDLIRYENLTLNEISLIIPHNVNLSSWRRLIDYLDIEKDKVFLENIPYYGHCFCSDGFINLNDAIKKSKIERGDYLVVATVGLGAYFSAALIQH